jgi:hypothetical protein
MAETRSDGTLRDEIVPDAAVTNDRSWSKHERATELARVGGQFVAPITLAGRFDTLVDCHARSNRWARPPSSDDANASSQPGLRR